MTKGVDEDQEEWALFRSRRRKDRDRRGVACDGICI